MSFKKISVVQTNNSPALLNNNRWVISQSLNESELQSLKDYAQAQGFQPSEGSETDLVLNTLKWVHAQWNHDGVNQPPSHYRALDILKSVHQENQQYRCVEYGIVLSELLQALGFTTRTVGLRTIDSAYGGFGQGHVAMEVWINELSKWIFLDPQFGASLMAENHLLNFYELHQYKKKEQWSLIKTHLTSGTSSPVSAEEYKSFLQNYFGHMKVSAGDKQPQICLALDAKDLPLTFQGHASNNVIFTDKVSLFYPEINKTTLFLSFKETSDDFQKLMSELKITSNEEYLQQMKNFAVKPQFSVKIDSSMSHLKGYEYRLSLIHI